VVSGGVVRSADIEEAHIVGMDAVGAGGDGLSPTFLGKKFSAREVIIIFRL
jgi:hypothetical protein